MQEIERMQNLWADSFSPLTSCRHCLITIWCFRIAKEGKKYQFFILNSRQVQCRVENYFTMVLKIGLRSEPPTAKRILQWVVHKTKYVQITQRAFHSAQYDPLTRIKLRNDKRGRETTFYLIHCFPYGFMVPLKVNS